MNVIMCHYRWEIRLSKYIEAILHKSVISKYCQKFLPRKLEVTKFFQSISGLFYFDIFH